LTTDIAIIGTGPAALAAAIAARRTDPDIQITVYDIGRTAESPQPNIANRNKLKLYDNLSFSYDQNEFLKFESNSLDVKVHSSAGFGGFSRVWGAVIDENPLSISHKVTGVTEMNKSKLLTSSGLSMYYRISRTIVTKHNSPLELLNHSLAVNESDCIKCGMCMKSCPTEAIWFAGTSWNGLDKISFVNNTYIKRVIEDEKKVTLVTENGSFVHSSLLVAAGPIGTAALLMRSGYLPKRIEFCDSQLIVLPIFRLPIIERKGRFSLSQISVKIKLPNGRFGHLQIYPDTRSILEELQKRSVIARFIPKPLLKVMTYFLSIGFVYLNSDDSHRLVLEVGDEDLLISKKENAQTSEICGWIQKTLPKLFLMCGYLIPKYLSSREPVGSSFHISGTSSLNYALQANNFKNILVVGSITHSNVDPGPITSRIITETISDVTAFLEHRK
jgi:ferredoxin